MNYITVARKYIFHKMQVGQIMLYRYNGVDQVNPLRPGDAYVRL